MSISEHTHMPEPVRRIEVFTGAGRRRNWSAAEKVVPGGANHVDFFSARITAAIARGLAADPIRTSTPAISSSIVRDGVMRLSAAQLQALLEGLDWRRVHESRRIAVRVAAT